PDVGPLLRTLQRSAGFLLALAPWLGLAVGLLSAQIYLAARYDVLGKAWGNLLPIEDFQHLARISGWRTGAVVAGVVLLGLVIALFPDRYRRYPVIQGITATIVPFAAALLLLFLTDPYSTAPNHIPIGALVIALASAPYYFVYHRLQAMRVD